MKTLSKIALGTGAVGIAVLASVTQMANPNVSVDPVTPVTSDAVVTHATPHASDCHPRRPARLANDPVVYLTEAPNATPDERANERTPLQNPITLRVAATPTNAPTNAPTNVPTNAPTNAPAIQKAMSARIAATPTNAPTIGVRQCLPGSQPHRQSTEARVEAQRHLSAGPRLLHCQRSPSHHVTSTPPIYEAVTSERDS